MECPAEELPMVFDLLVVAVDLDWLVAVPWVADPGCRVGRAGVTAAVLAPETKISTPA